MHQCAVSSLSRGLKSCPSEVRRAKEQLQRDDYKHLAEEDYELNEMVYFKLYESHLPTIERALLVAARRVVV